MMNYFLIIAFNILILIGINNLATASTSNEISDNFRILQKDSSFRELINSSDIDKSELNVFNSLNNYLNSVYKVEMIFSWNIITDIEFKTFIKSDNFVNSSLSNSIKQIILFYYDHCNENSNDCRIPVDIHTGTGFTTFINNINLFWTNAHNIIPGILKTRGNSKNFDVDLKSGAIKVPFFIFDNKNKLLATPDNITATLRESPSEAEINFVESKKGEFYLKDYVSIELSQSIGNPLKIEPIISSENKETKLFAVGYPTCPDCIMQKYKILGKLTVSDSQYISIGVAIKNSSDHKFVMGSRSTESSDYIESNMPCGHGFSGSPIFNEKGNVVSIHFSRGDNSSISVRPPSWNH